MCEVAMTSFATSIFETGRLQIRNKVSHFCVALMLSLRDYDTRTRLYLMGSRRLCVTDLHCGLYSHIGEDKSMPTLVLARIS
jgi:hypothetical protein